MVGSVAEGPGGSAVVMIWPHRSLNTREMGGLDQLSAGPWAAPGQNSGSSLCTWLVKRESLGRNPFTAWFLLKAPLEEAGGVRSSEVKCTAPSLFLAPGHMVPPCLCSWASFSVCMSYEYVFKFYLLFFWVGGRWCPLY